MSGLVVLVADYDGEILSRREYGDCSLYMDDVEMVCVKVIKIVAPMEPAGSVTGED